MLYNVVMQMPDGSVEHWCRDVTDPNLLHLAVKAACSARKGADVYVECEDGWLNPDGQIVQESERLTWRKKMGRPRQKEKAISRSVTLMQGEWEMLAQADPDGSPTRETARRLRAKLR